jgi:hypothetical protein
MSKTSVDLLTRQEHAIVADWLGVAALCDTAGLPSASDALKELGFHGKTYDRSEADAAVASIVLEAIQKRLPQWSWKAKLASGGSEILNPLYWCAQATVRSLLARAAHRPQQLEGDA